MNRSTPLAVITSAFSCAVLGTSCVSSASSEHTPTWTQEIALQVDAKLGGCVVADFDPEIPGDEIVVTASDGTIHYLWRADGEWHSAAAFVSPGEMIQCAAGDLDPACPGDELLVVGALQGGEDEGGKGAVWVGRRAAGAWEFEKVFEDDALVHAACIGELDDEHAGVEALVAGYTKQAYLLSLSGGTWKKQALGPLDGPAKGATITGDGGYIACADGSLMHVQKKAQGWSTSLYAHYSQALARISSHSGIVLFSANDGYLRRTTEEGADVLYESSDRLRGAVFADLEPEYEGVEMATAGYDGNISIIRLAPDGRAIVTHVGSDTDRLHHLATGSIAGLGTVLVACGYSGHVIVVHRTNR